MLRILIVEDEPLLATTLKYLIELNPRFQTTAIADDLESALAAVEERRPIWPSSTCSWPGVRPASAWR